MQSYNPSSFPGWDILPFFPPVQGLEAPYKEQRSGTRGGAIPDDLRHASPTFNQLQGGNNFVKNLGTVKIPPSCRDWGKKSGHPWGPLTLTADINPPSKVGLGGGEQKRKEIRNCPLKNIDPFWMSGRHGRQSIKNGPTVPRGRRQLQGFALNSNA